MKVVWLGIAAAFGCLAVASFLHYLYVTLYLPHASISKILGVSTGIPELYNLTQWIVILEVAGFIVACFAALVDARENHAKK